MTFFNARDYDEMKIPIARIANRNQTTAENIRNVQGRAARMYYRGPQGRSSLEVARNYEEKLRSQGFEITFFCRTTECGGQELWWLITDQLKGAGFPPNWENQTFLSARRPAQGTAGEVHVAILAVEQGGAAQTLVDVIETRPMESGRIVILDASQLRSAIDRDGRAVLYGLQFDFDKAELKPESKPQLDAIVGYLRANAGVSVIVAGHTDNRGGYDYNLDLSRRRAQSVVQALTREGIPAQRLTAFGAGMAAPVAANETDDGRTKNRRVEIVKR